MNIVDSTGLIKKYATCPKCESDKLGNGEGTLNIKDEVFERACKCGWSVTVDKRIKVIATATKKVKGKTTGIYEVNIYGEKKHKYLPANELKQLAGVRRINQYSKVEDWLNTIEGRTWAMETPHVTDF